MTWRPIFRRAARPSHPRVPQEDRARLAHRHALCLQLRGRGQVQAAAVPLGRPGESERSTSELSHGSH